MGGLDWGGLDIVCALLGVDDPEALIHRLAVIKHYRPPEADKNGTADTVD